jgi:hypothetical protein
MFKKSRWGRSVKKIGNRKLEIGNEIREDGWPLIFAKGL